jgi:hypothetical protein
MVSHFLKVVNLYQGMTVSAGAEDEFFVVGSQESGPFASLASGVKKYFSAIY